MNICQIFYKLKILKFYSHHSCHLFSQNLPVSLLASILICLQITLHINQYNVPFN